VDGRPSGRRRWRAPGAEAKWTAAATAAAVFSVAQLLQGTVRDNPPTSVEIPAPPAVRRILRRSCYDCHSNETRWPWYSGVAPASWLVSRDVQEGRMHMNFSRWPESPPPGMDCHFRRRIADRVAAQEMPPLRYRLLHPASGVEPQEVARLEAWAEECSSGG
jgi:hypothetical protein